MAVGVCASGRIGVGYARRAPMDGTECDNYLHAGPEARFLVISHRDRARYSYSGHTLSDMALVWTLDFGVFTFLHPR